MNPFHNHPGFIASLPGTPHFSTGDLVGEADTAFRMSETEGSDVVVQRRTDLRRTGTVMVADTPSPGTVLEATSTTVSQAHFMWSKHSSNIGAVLDLDMVALIGLGDEATSTTASRTIFMRLKDTISRMTIVDLHADTSWAQPVGLRPDVTTPLMTALAAAQSGNMRSAYRQVFGLLDRQFLAGHWNIVSAVLKALCSDKYPLTLGIGAVRFSSSAASKIPNWKALLSELTRRANAEGMEHALRGLVEE